MFDGQRCISHDSGVRGPKRIRVIFVSRMFPQPGRELAGVFVLEQAKALAERGIEVEVVCPIPIPFLTHTAWAHLSRDEETRASSCAGLRVTYLPYPHFPVRLSSTLESHSLAARLVPTIRRLALSRKIDALHAHALFPTGFASTVAGQLLDIPVVCTAHGSDVHTHPLRNRGIARITRATIRQANRIIGVSKDLQRRMYELEPANRGVEVIYSGVDPSIFRRQWSPSRERFDLGLPLDGVGICTVSRLDAAKGILELMRAFETLHQKIPRVWMSIVGDGPLRASVREWAAKFEGAVFVTGAVPHSKVSRYMNASDIFALPSHREGVPVAILEAMACGLPVVATSVGGIPEVVSDSHTGFLVAVGDVPRLTLRLEQLIENAQLRETMSARGRAMIENRFLWSHGAEQLERVYRQVAERRGR